ncbi:class I SAM-dependent methyltransferase [Saccharopolyspora phatthalungensis]|uniref:Ubiquinone/menaquinone biosynthesis C-methylase UbiE n=1 Tax=Saccharopolyspora phatthalungensis TaxID=664693 RepID=A0A840QAG9_9PSEU|nr:class I SAM-dependent methyltransferase [Saccharopolyspora phatthalungensis]MBB5159532.1 ubiquinone/menaquinone biosynthesis C-methylase UbiE [Saccharopolyspora phatthalungensis]
MQNLRVREMMLGIQGVALLRNAIDGSQEFVDARLREIQSLLDGEPNDPSKAVTELGVSPGYASWATTYDSLPSSVIQTEEPVVHGIIDRLPAGKALDAACGTGRHAAALVARGHDTTGVDQSAEMLAQASAKAPDAEFRTGDLTALPLPDRSVDLTVCSLALTHLADVSAAVREFARVTREGGHVIITDVHPILVILQGGQALFAHGGELAFVRNHFHPVSKYLNAFAAAGLVVESCAEPLFNGLLPPEGHEERIAEAAQAAWAGIPSVLVWHLRVRA